MGQVKAITPDEAKHEKQDVIPEAVLEVVNRLLKERYDGRSAILRQPEVLSEALAMMNADGANVTKDDFYKRHWLDFEQLYIDAGWKVTYDKPGWDESYDPYWKFERK